MEQELQMLAKLLIERGAAVRIDCGGVDLNALMESRYRQALAEIRAVLDDGTLDDPACFRRIERIVEIFEDLGPGGGSRHDF